MESAKDARTPGKKSYGLTLINLKRTKMTERSLDKLGIGRADATIDAHAQELSQTANTGMVIFTVVAVIVFLMVIVGGFVAWKSRGMQFYGPYLTYGPYGPHGPRGPRGPYGPHGPRGRFY